MYRTPTTPPVPATGPGPAPLPARRSGATRTIAAVTVVAVGFAAGFLGLQWLLAEVHEPTPHPPVVHAQLPSSAADPARSGAAAGPGWSLRAPETRALDAQSFDVEHVMVGDDATELASFSARVEVAPTVTVLRDTGLPDGGRGDAVQVYLTDRVTTSDVVKKDPLGLAKVGWETDLTPLPNYGYQAITGGVAHFDNGATVRAERGTSFQLVFPVPAGAGSLDRLDLDFDWLDQGRTLTFVP